MTFPKGWELVLIVLVIVLLFGARKLPDAARGLGRSLRIFKAEIKDPNDEEGRDGLVEPAPSTAVHQPAITATPVGPGTPAVPVQPVVPVQPTPPVQQFPPVQQPFVPSSDVSGQQPAHQPVQHGQQTPTER